MHALRLPGTLAASSVCLLLTVAAGAQTADLAPAIDIDNFARVQRHVFPRRPARG